MDSDSEMDMFVESFDGTESDDDLPLGESFDALVCAHTNAPHVPRGPCASLRMTSANVLAFAERRSFDQGQEPGPRSTQNSPEELVRKRRDDVPPAGHGCRVETCK